jgi:hypothetical protein
MGSDSCRTLGAPTGKILHCHRRALREIANREGVFQSRHRAVSITGIPLGARFGANLYMSGTHMRHQEIGVPGFETVA